MKAVIIADDLTGALDAVAPFVGQGQVCLTVTDLSAIPQAVQRGPDVLAISLGSREVAGAVAEARSAQATGVLQTLGVQGALWFKKIDSRLKGNLAAEIQGMARAAGLDRLHVCPAIPELGRVVRQGMLQGFGVAEPLSVAGALGAGMDAQIHDAQSDADLDCIAALAGPGVLFVGARGLAAAVARRLPFGTVTAPQPVLPGPVRFVIGSRDPLTLEQVARLRQAPGGPVWIGAPDGQVPMGAVAGPVIAQAVAGPGADGATVAGRLASGVLALCKPAGGTMVLTGGETASAVLAAAGIHLLHVLGEAQPGLPLCRALDGPAGFPLIITKSGGFGGPDSLLQIWQATRPAEGQT